MSLVKKTVVFFLAAVTGTLLIAGACVAREEGEFVEEFDLYAGEARAIPVSGPHRFVVSKPQVATVTDTSASEITVTAQSPGTTSVILWDNFGEQAFKVRVFAEDMREIKLRIDGVLKELAAPGVYTKAIDSEGRVLLLGEVKTVQEKERILAALDTLKDKTVNLIKIKEEEGVIDIDVQVLELDRDGTKNLGLTWPGAVTVTDQPPESRSAFFDVTKWTRTNFGWRLDALVREGKARILSRPSLACQSGKEAELLVGGEKPIMTTMVTALSGSKGTKVEYKEFGIKLNIKPVITEDQRIKLGLKVEVSDVEAPVTIGSTTTTSALAYPVSKRTASTELFLDDGQTLAIGGLIKQKTEEEIRKMPWLADIPVLGLFFRKKEVKTGSGSGMRGNTELFITITPKVIEKAKDRGLSRKQLVTAPAPMMLQTVASMDPVLQYASVIQTRLLQNIRYPRQAREAGFAGTVKLGLHLSYRGELLEGRVKESSGYQILDEQTLRAAKGISLYPPFPPTIKAKDLWVDIPIAFKPD